MIRLRSLVFQILFLSWTAFVSTCFSPLLLRASGTDAEDAVSVLAQLILDRFGFKDD